MHPFTILALTILATSLPAADMTGDTMKRDLVYVSGTGPMVSCFALDGASGSLTLLSESAGGNRPAYLAWGPTRRFMYAINEDNPGRIVAFAIDPVSGALRRLNDASSGGDGTTHLAVHPSGKWLIAANYGSGHVGVLPITGEGTLGEPVDVQLPGKKAHQVVIDASGRFVFVPCLGSDVIAQFRFDQTTGKLAANDPASVATAVGAGPRHLVVTSDGTTAYGINELDSTLTSYALDPSTGVLQHRATVSTLPVGFSGLNTTAHILVSADGRFVYGSNRGHDSIAVFRAGDGGKLDLLAHHTGDGEIKVPRDFTLSRDGSLLLCANQNGGTVTIFKVDHVSGTLSRIAAVPVPGKPTFVGVMPPP